MGVSTTLRREFGEHCVTYTVVTGTGGQLDVTKAATEKSARFWPASGRWLGKGDSKGYGLVSLLHYLNKE